MAKDTKRFLAALESYAAEHKQLIEPHSDTPPVPDLDILLRAEASSQGSPRRETEAGLTDVPAKLVFAWRLLLTRVAPVAAAAAVLALIVWSPGAGLTMSGYNEAERGGGIQLPKTLKVNLKRGSLLLEGSAGTLKGDLRSTGQDANGVLTFTCVLEGEFHGQAGSRFSGSASFTNLATSGKARVSGAFLQGTLLLPGLSTNEVSRSYSLGESAR